MLQIARERGRARVKQGAWEGGRQVRELWRVGLLVTLDGL